MSVLLLKLPTQPLVYCLNLFVYSPFSEGHVSSIWGQVAIGGAWGLILSWVMIRWVAPLGLLDHPDGGRKHHTKATPRTGGLTLWMGLVVIQVAGLDPFGLHPLDWFAIHSMAFTGLLDDRYNLRARYKAVVGLGVALLLALHVSQTMGSGASHVFFLGMPMPTSALFIVPLLTAWFWAMPQAYNLIDGINGLSMGFAALLLGVLGWNLGVQSALLWGGLLAVAALNFPKAHHFLGDCGALMLGTLFAVLGVQAFGLRNPDLLLWVFAYPVVDVSLVVGIRRWRGHSLSRADRSHLHHWMMEKVHGRAWLATPVLLCLAFLPMTRTLGFPGHQVLSGLGLVALLSLALKVFKDRVTEGAPQTEGALVYREIPLLIPRARHEPSGTHPLV